MENKKPEIVYSEPVREIMGKPPRMILRYGTALIFLVFILVVIFSWYFRYPDLVPSPVEITTENPPVTLVSKGTYKIRHLYIKDGEKVAKEQLLGVMETVASIDDERSLRQFTDTCKSIYSTTDKPDARAYGAWRTSELLRNFQEMHCRSEQLFKK